VWEWEAKGSAEFVEDDEALEKCCGVGDEDGEGDDDEEEEEGDRCATFRRFVGVSCELLRARFLV
tara:strand:- start:39 stop:233 length:195 start_codon:yes stop_codon:yes gene_type:complete